MHIQKDKLFTIQNKSETSPQVSGLISDPVHCAPKDTVARLSIYHDNALVVVLESPIQVIRDHLTKYNFPVYSIQETITTMCESCE